MTEDEDIGSYMLQVQEFVSQIFELGGEVKESEIVKKVLRSLPKY